MPNYTLVDNDDGTFKLTLFLLDLSASPTIYAIITASAQDTIYNLLNNIIDGGDNVNPT